MVDRRAGMTDGEAVPVDGTGVLVDGTRVLVTGGAGFVGSAVVRALTARNCEVVALVEPGGNTTNLDGHGRR
jgi:FlaA1/EpsC-like NDP-sugar epimerase